MAHGNILHDSHAEIVAIRAFNRFLLDQCSILEEIASATSPYIRRQKADEISEKSPQPFTIHEDVTIHMYGSEAPCGDASMELIMAAQNDATPWEVSPAPEVDTALKGRGSFAELGTVRRKPARPDAPPTLSKSCTDKLAMYQFTSILSSVTSLLVSPKRAYLATLTIPASQYEGSAVTRAFGHEGRLRAAITASEGRSSFHPFQVQTTSVESAWSRRAVSNGQTAIASNVSAVYTPMFTETLINGVLQGRKLGDSKGASRVSRRMMWVKAAEIARMLHDDVLISALHVESYDAVKGATLLADRRYLKDHVKRGALKGWIRNTGDGNFSLR
jgi:tRNA-specific adenosine deaminase 1